VRHNLILANLDRPALDEHASNLLWWTLGAPGACAVQTPGYPIVLGELTPTQCGALADETRDLDYPGVVGPDRTAQWFAERAIELGLTFLEPIPQQIHVLRDKPNYPGAPGHARVIRPGEVELFGDWTIAFLREAVPHDPLPSRERLAQIVAEGRHQFWIVDGEPVSMAGIVRRTRGSIDPLSLDAQRGSAAPAILLGGRSWRVLDVDWPHRTVSVEPATEVGRSRWFGSSRVLHAELAHSIEQVLATGNSGVTLSSRARASLDGMREAMPYINGEVLPVVSTGDELRIWTFAGGRANAMLAQALHRAGGSVGATDNFCITLLGMNQASLAAALDKIPDEDCRTPVDRRMMAELKFGICLPEKLAQDVLRVRLSDFGTLRLCLQRPRKWIRICE
jgi:hypothetical protein